MKVFVTGATGFIGSAVVAELLQNGHSVLGLTRSEAGAQKLRAAGAEVHHGSLEDLASLKAGAAAADGVIHLAFIHTFPGVFLAPSKDKKAISALGEALAGTNKPLVVAGAIHAFRSGVLLTEDYTPNYAKVPRKSEEAVLSFGSRGVRASVVRLPPTVHGDGDKGFVSWLVKSAKKRGQAVYVGDGKQRWAAVHRFDAARLFRFIVENPEAHGVYHGVGDEGVPFGEIAEFIGRDQGVPTASKSRWGAIRALGFLGFLASIDSPASSQRTQNTLGWKPEHPTLLEDFAAGVYKTPKP